MAKVVASIPVGPGFDGDALREAIVSLVQQTRLPDELLIVVSTPSDIRPVQAIVDSTGPPMTWRVEAYDGAGGLAAALNWSLLNSEGDYYLRMDADDICKRDRVERQVNFLEKNPNMGVVGTWAKPFSREGKSTDHVTWKPPEHDAQIRKALHYMNPVLHPSVCFRKSIFSRLGIYDTKYKGEQDLELWMRCARKGVRMANLPYVGLEYCVDGVADRRSDLSSALRQARLRLSYWTFNPILCGKKVAAIIFRFLPTKAQRMLYLRLKAGVYRQIPEADEPLPENTAGSKTTGRDP